jgi:hypothetical protein
MSRLLKEWQNRKFREDELLHEQLRGGMAGGRVQVFTDPRVLDFQGSPVHQHWDHLLPLTGLMTLALIILLASGIVIGIVVMTLCVLTHLFGNKYYVAWRLRIRALAYLTDNVAQFQALWNLGGIALVMKDGNEPPCLAPKGDWRKFIRRNLGEGEAPRTEALANAPVPSTARAVRAEPEPEPEPVPEPMADFMTPPEPSSPPPPRTHWESIDDQPPRDEVVPPTRPS